MTNQSEGENSMTVEHHLDVAKVATREVQKLLDIARYQGQWTSTKSLQYQAIKMGGVPDYMLRQFEAAIERIERNLNELGAINQRSKPDDQPE